MWTLAIETSGMGGSLALLRDETVQGHRQLDPQRRHARSLVPEIRTLFTDAQLALADCGLIAVSHGPGSFTGLRVGIVCAKTLAYATQVPLVAVDTFQALAVGCPAEVERVQVIMNAQRQELFFAEFARTSSLVWETLQPLRIVKQSDWLEQLTTDTWVTGPALEQSAEACQGRCRMLPVESWQPTAVNVGRLGRELFHAGQTTSCWDLEPRYVRLSAAEEKWLAQTGNPNPA